MATPFARPTSISEKLPRAEEGVDWVEIAAGASLITGGLLLLTGYKRVGTLAAASGAALALLDQKETVCALWERLPGYIDEFRHLLGEVQGSVEEIAEKRERLRTLIHR